MALGDCGHEPCIKAAVKLCACSNEDCFIQKQQMRLKIIQLEQDLKSTRAYLEKARAELITTMEKDFFRSQLGGK